MMNSESSFRPGVALSYENCSRHLDYSLPGNNRARLFLYFCLMLCLCAVRIPSFVKCCLLEWYPREWVRTAKRREREKPFVNRLARLCVWGDDDVMLHIASNTAESALAAAI